MSTQTLEQMESDLRLAGFIEYYSSLSHEHAVSKWELKVHNENGKIEYLVRAFLYKKYGSNRRSDYDDGVVEFEATLYQEMRDDEWITLQLHGSNIKSALFLFSDAYTDLCCELDRHNN
jgi:hypothetical protein